MVINGAPGTFWELIESRQDGVEIPRIQRDYIQGRNTPKITYSLGKLLDDIKLALNGGDNIDLNYIYGVNAVDTGAFVPVDGQQRLTTLLCLHFYAFARDGKISELRTLGERFFYKTRLSTGRFLQCISEHLDEYFAHGVSGSISEFVKNSAWYLPSWDHDPSIESFLIVLDKIKGRFADVTDLAEILLDKGKRPITFMQLMVEEMGNPDIQYIKMNSRGKQLTDFETFKSELFDFVGDTDPNSTIFKAKIDGDWMNVIWKKCQSSSTTQEFDPKSCDRLYMLLLHRIILNSIEVHSLDSINNDTKKAIEVIKNRKSFYNFRDYKIFLDIGNRIVLKDIYFTLQCLCYLHDNAPDVFQTLTFLPVDGIWQEKMGLSLYVFAKYATELAENHWSDVSFKKWHRVTTNIINNVERAASAIAAAKNRISTLPPQSLADIYTYLNDNADQVKIDVNRDRQISEEILKSKLICANPDWEKELIIAERHGYFNGEINFALRLLDIDESNLKFDSTTLLQFANNWEKVKEIFWEKSPNTSWITLRRVLLCFGDYGYYDSNQSYGSIINRLINYYCVEYEQHANKDWRGLLRNFYRDNYLNHTYDGFAVFRKMFEAFVASGKSFKVFCKDTLAQYAQTPCSATSNREELIYYLTADGKMFAYIDSWGRIWESGKNQFYLLATKVRMRGIHYKLYALYDRVAGEYREFKNSGDSENYITYKGHEIRYDPAKDRYTVDGTPVLTNGTEIKWIRDMNAYLLKL